jgi:hypothetical protein
MILATQSSFDDQLLHPVRLGKSRGEQNGSARPQVADASADCTEGPDRAKGLNRSRGRAPGLATEARGIAQRGVLS